jgi:hypothetical protein
MYDGQTGSNDELPAKSSFRYVGPPHCRKRKVRRAFKVCAYVYGLVGAISHSEPGWNALRSVLINLAVFKDLYRKQVFRVTVRPWCHLVARQQTWQENKTP